MKSAILPLLTAMALLTPVSARAQSAPPTPLFSSDAPIHIAINAPLNTLIRNRALGTSVSGTLVDPAGQSVPVTLSVRSTTRRNSEICDFPPLRVTFGRSSPTSLFAGQSKLKLVTHCGGSPGAQQYELLEYSAYRMLNQLTPRSFRVRLASIDYQDGSGRPMFTRYGFFIEPLKDVGRRNGLRPLQTQAMIPIGDLSPTDSARYALFQHMIANHDWSMRAPSAGKACCHNAEMLGVLAPGAAIPIPYDFDYSGLVGAPYAVPPEQMNLASVKSRYYRGFCAHNGQALAVAQQFRAARPQILGVLAQTPGLDSRTISRAASFLNGFFADIATDQDVSAKVLKRCAG
jgi:hypothetical protein